MNTRTTRKIVTFNHPFLLASVGRTLLAGSYEVITDEELIDGLSFPVYRRMATMMMVPAQSSHASTEMLTVDPLELAAALDHEASAEKDAAIATKPQ
jgi:hypothetical protein